MLRFDPTPYNILNGLGQWAMILGAFLLVALIVSFFVAVATVGFRRAPKEMAEHLRRGFRELVLVSPRRVWAITQLVIRESVRRKALLVFVVFALLFMFGSWFLSESGERPGLQAAVHITFVLKAIAFLTIPVVLLLGVLGIASRHQAALAAHGRHQTGPAERSCDGPHSGIFRDRHVHSGRDGRGRLFVDQPPGPGGGPVATRLPRADLRVARFHRP